MKNPVSADIPLKIFAWLGAVAVILMFATLAIFIRVLPVSVPFPAQGDLGQAAYSEPLGELGSHCGGPERLPCKPGTQCSYAGTDTAQYGVCQPAPTAAGAATALSQQDQPCGDSMFCDVGLYCKKIGSGAAFYGTCKTVDSLAPFVVSVAMDGMQPDPNGGYRAAAGTKATVRVQTVNAKVLTMELNVVNARVDATQSLGEVKAEGAGKYSATLNVVKGLSGKILITAESKTGDKSWLTIPISAIE